MTLFEVINEIGFYAFSEIDKTYIVNILLYYFPLLVFQVVRGTYIYRHFCTASVYYFTRVDNRIRWYLKESMKLYISVVLYLMLYVSIVCVLRGYKSGIVFTKESFILLIYYLLIHSLWLYMLTLLINVFAIMFNSNIAFLIVMGMQAACILHYVIFQNYLDFSTVEELTKKKMMLKSNPFSHIILSWHSSVIKCVNEKINIFGISFDLNESVVVCFCMTAIVLIVGTIIVKKTEIITLNKE